MKFLHRSKQNYPQLDEVTASKMLENIFAACAMEPNAVPINVLASYSNYRKERYSFQRVTLAFIMLLFCLLPLLFIPPRIHVQELSSDQIGHPVYELSVDTFFPAVNKISATIDGVRVPIYETGERIYTIQPTRNGDMTITIVLGNRQYEKAVISVTGVDCDAPVLLNSSLKNGELALYLDDDISGIDYKNIIAADMSGNMYTPTSYDEDAQCVLFTDFNTNMNIFIPDHAGNELQLVLTIK